MEGATSLEDTLHSKHMYKKEEYIGPKEVSPYELIPVFGEAVTIKRGVCNQYNFNSNPFGLLTFICQIANGVTLLYAADLAYSCFF